MATKKKQEKQLPEVRVGDVWMSADKGVPESRRHKFRFRVDNLESKQVVRIVHGKSVKSMELHAYVVPVEQGAGANPRWIRVDRFKPTANGYQLVERK